MEKIVEKVYNINPPNKKKIIKLNLPCFRRTVNLIIDTGSSISLVKASTLKSKNSILNFQTHFIYGLNSEQPVKTLGTIVEVYIDRSKSMSFQFEVINDDDTSLHDELDGILGLENLKSCNISFIENLLFFNSNKICFPIYEFIEPQESLKRKINMIQHTNTIEYSINTNQKPILNRFKYIIENLSLSHLELSLQDKIKELIHKNTSVFFVPGDILKPCNGIKQNIRLTTDEPINKKQFPFAFHEYDIIQNKINELLKLNIIDYSQETKYNSPIFLKVKEDNSHRLIMDGRYLNEYTEPDKLEMPSFDEIISKLQNAKIFTKLDLKTAYWQIPINPSDTHKLTFTFNGKRYKFLRSSMGLRNAGTVFGVLINKVLEKHLNKYVINFVDDVLIYSQNINDHIKHIDLIMKELKKYNLTLEAKKCQFCVPSIEFLGHIIEHNKIFISKKNTQAMLDIKYPHNLKTTRAVIGLFNYANRFIPNYASLIAPLNNLLRKNVKFNFDTNCKNSVDQLKQVMTSKPFLYTPNFHSPMIIRSDASLTHIAGALFQFDEGGNERILGYFSRSLHDNEKKLAIMELELIALVESITKIFYKYLIHSKFYAMIDNLSLVKFLSNPMDTGTSSLIRKKLKLIHFDFKIFFLSSKENKICDFLSRMSKSDSKAFIIADDKINISKIPDRITIIHKNSHSTYVTTRSKSKSNKICYKDEFEKFTKLTENQNYVNKNSKIVRICNDVLDLNPKNNLNLFFATEDGNNLSKEVKNIFNKIPTFQKIEKDKSNIFINYKKNINETLSGLDLFSILQELKNFLRDCKITNKSIFIHQFNDKNFNIYDLKLMLNYIFSNDSIFFKIIEEEIKFLDDIEEIEALILLHHNNFFGAHSGQLSTLKRLKRFVKFNNMKETVKNVLEKCDKCQFSKPTARTKRTMKIATFATSCFTHISIDLVGAYPTSDEGYTHVLTILDTFSHYINIIPLKETTTEAIANALIFNHFLIFGIADVIFCDNARNLCNNTTEKLGKIFDYKNITSSIYSPKTQKVERLHRDLASYMKSYLSENNANQWDKFIKFFVFSHNNHKNFTNFSPHQIIFGKELKIPYENVDLIIEENNYDYDSYVYKLQSTLKSLRKINSKAIQDSKEKRVENYNKGAKPVKFYVGQLVKVKNFKTGMGSKLFSRYLGPAEVVQTGNDYCYVKLDNQIKKYNYDAVFPYISND